MKWYFAMSESSIDRNDHDWRDLIRVAVGSARANTSLRPHMLYDGAPSDFTREMQALGVAVIHHRVGFYDAIEAHSRHDPWFIRIASGAFLRIEIPLVETEDEFVLYTDVDVQFRHEVSLAHLRPRLFAAAPQSELGDRADMNSGVMLINVPAMRQDLPGFSRFIAENLSLGLDQDMLRARYGDTYDMLSPLYNWKPYWHVNQEAPIIHWHGPKPTVARRRVQDPAWSSNVPVWDHLMARNPAGYAWCVARWDEALAACRP